MTNAPLAGTNPQDVGIFSSGTAGAQPAADGCRILPASCDIWALVEGAQSVHAEADDDMAIVAGLLGVPVFGRDGQAIVPDQLRQAAMRRLGAARYRDCFTGKPVSIAAAIRQLSDWRRHLEGNRGIAAATGMAFWKRSAIGQFLWDGTRSPPCLSPVRALRRARYAGGALAAWPSRVPAALWRHAAAKDVPIYQVEDGFLRSRGLGADLHAPSSVVVDRSGIYYDSGSSNDLETLLATHAFPPSLIKRAQALRHHILETGVGKYGKMVGQPVNPSIEWPVARRIVLAVGQVEDDRSMLLGGADVAGNLDFLQRVRRAEPDAWILYRPHPDVRAGHRKGHVPDSAALRQADCIDEGSPLMALIEKADAVHVVSSLTGFEALLRGKAVTTHGMPFFAGWGLTHDLAPSTGRRERRLTLDQMVAGALILYPRYLDPVTRLPCGPELLVDRMASGAMPPATALIRLRELQGKLRRVMTLSTEWLHG